MSHSIWRVALCGLVIGFLYLDHARAHEIAGNRFFPATLAIDDPGVNDEMAFPTISAFKTGDDPSAKELDISGEFAKRITDDFAVSFEPTWTHISRPGGPNMNGASGFQNLETALKYRFSKNADHEFVASVGFNIEWGHSGAEAVGAEPVTSYTPTAFFGKGFGDLPDSMGWARPFAITGQIGYAFPNSRTTSIVDPDDGSIEIETNPDVLVWGGSLQYSMPYLKSSVKDLGLPDFFNHLIPIVEFSMQTPAGHTIDSGTLTTGTINPGVIWVGDKYQIGVEAVIPVNRESGKNVGVIGQLHFYLDDIFPNSIGRPLLASSAPAGRPTLGR
ncbi:MAG TPA: hypothetical protein VFX37_00240 [Pseudolabrys sp.]|nr:hypothetical protein [Pseudolabrys sp.]